MGISNLIKMATDFEALAEYIIDTAGGKALENIEDVNKKKIKD